MLRWVIVGIAFYLFSVQPILTAEEEKPAKPVGRWSTEGKGGDAIVWFKLNSDGTLSGGWRDGQGAYDFEGDYSVTKWSPFRKVQQAFGQKPRPSEKGRFVFF